MRTLRVLVVDDNELVGQSVLRVLRPHTVVHERDPIRALGLALTQPFDGILVDVDMPDITGIEFIAKLEEYAPQIARKAVVLTGSSEVDEGEVATPLVWKPFTREDVDRLYWWWTGGDKE